jgi:hypothetical protein
MKTNKNSTRWLGLALACGTLTYAATSQAGKPPPEPPPPSGPAYWIIRASVPIAPYSISDSGVLVGHALYEYSGGGVQSPAVLPPQISDGEPQYLTSDLRWLPGLDGSQHDGNCLAMNETGLAVGYINDLGLLRAILWLPDGTAVDLGASIGGLPSTANDINDAGLVLVGIGYENQQGERGGVVVPLDLVGGDGVPDTWFTDDDADGINDLFFLTDTGHNLLPVAINEAGQVLAAQIVAGQRVAGYLLTPDLTDADGDGNPWFADRNSDGFNDLLVSLAPPEPGASVSVAGLNNLGQVVGKSGVHAVRWEFVQGVQIVSDLGSLSDRLAMGVAGISDSGRMAGSSRHIKGAFHKPGPSWLIEGETLYELLPLVVNSDGWSDLEVEGVNRHGWIYGLGRFNDVLGGFVAIPVEEP